MRHIAGSSSFHVDDAGETQTWIRYIRVEIFQRTLGRCATPSKLLSLNKILGPCWLRSYDEDDRNMNGIDILNPFQPRAFRTFGPPLSVFIRCLEQIDEFSPLDWRLNRCSSSYSCSACQLTATLYILQVPTCASLKHIRYRHSLCKGRLNSSRTEKSKIATVSNMTREIVKADGLLFGEYPLSKRAREAGLPVASKTCPSD